MSRIKVFSPYPTDPLQVRLEAVLRELEQAGHEVTLVRHARSRLERMARLASMDVFGLPSLRQACRQMRDADLVYIQDIRFALLLPLARILGKPAVYETLDFGAHVRFHHFRKRFSFGRWFGWWFAAAQLFENILVRCLASAIVVNSAALRSRFGRRARFIPYSSPLEDTVGPCTNGRPPALLYLGIFSPEKGAADMLELHRKTNVPLYVFGEVTDMRAVEGFENDAGVVLSGRVSSGALAARLRELGAARDLLGLSLIRSVHHSYAVQEANKDIDYLAIRAPIIGNRRETTAAKIRSGCGVFADNEAGVARLLTDPDFRRGLSGECARVYRDRYSRALFRDRLLEVVRECCP